MTEIKAGNTVESMKPKEVFAAIPVAQPRYEDEDGKTWGYNSATGQWDIPVAPQNPELICPDIDECAPVINAGQDLPFDVHSEKMNEKFREIVSRESNKMFPQIGGQESTSERALQIPEEIPPTNLWSLRWRINELEKRVDELFDRAALFNVRSGQKL